MQKCNSFYLHSWSYWNTPVCENPQTDWPSTTEFFWACPRPKKEWKSEDSFAELPALSSSDPVAAQALKLEKDQQLLVTNVLLPCSATDCCMNVMTTYRSLDLNRQNESCMSHAFSTPKRFQDLRGRPARHCEEMKMPSSTCGGLPSWVQCYAGGERRKACWSFGTLHPACA